MRTIRRTTLAILTLSATILLALPAIAAEWHADPAHCSITFEVSHMAISKIKGKFEKYAVDATGEPGKPATFQATAKVAVASLSTDNEQRDNDLRSPNFFDAEKYPDMTFRSTGVTMDGNKGKLAGELTIHGVTKPVTFDLEYAGMITDPWGNVRMGFSAETTIDRRDFGLTYNKVLEAGGLVVGNDVEIELELEMVQAK